MINQKENIRQSWNTYVKDMNFFSVSGFIKRHKKKPVNEKTHAKIYRYFYEYCEASTFHGCKQLSYRGRHWLEYLLWSLAVVTALSMTFYVSMFSWNRYNYFPTVIVIEKNNHEWNITFPSATFCPNEKVDKGLLQNLAKNYNAKNETEFVDFFYGLSKSTLETYSFLPDYDEIAPDEYLKIIVEAAKVLAYNVSSTLTEETENLEHVFTEFGICYSYNSKIAPFFDPNALIGKATEIARSGELLYISLFDDDSFVINEMEYWEQYNMSISGPYEIPAEGTALVGSMLMMPSKEIEVACSAIISTDEVRELSVEQRNCKTRSDGGLLISKVYSYNLCRMECRMNLGYSLCGCVPYVYSTFGSLVLKQKMKICDVKGLKCLGNHGTWLSDLRDPKTKQKVDCGCHSLCTDFNFRVLSAQDFNWGVRQIKWQMAYFPKARYKRTIIFGFSDMIVGIGSTAGLFMGCSVLSFVEVAYFFTLRIVFAIYSKIKSKNSNDHFRKTKKISSFEFSN